LVFNVEENVELARRGDVCVRGYVWGQPVDPLLRALSAETADAEAPRASFDLILLSDLIFNHSQVRHHHHLLSGQLKYIHIYAFLWSKTKNKKHRALLTTCERAIASAGCVLVFYTHHRPHLAQRDMEFFDMARESGWECEKVLTERFPVRFSVFVAHAPFKFDLFLLSFLQ
jgi:nicotinamide N-methyltransferase